MVEQTVAICHKSLTVIATCFLPRPIIEFTTEDSTLNNNHCLLRMLKLVHAKLDLFKIAKCSLHAIISRLKVVTFSLITFIPTVCLLPQWNIALIAIGASAMLFTLVTAILIIGIVVLFFHRNSELCEVVAPSFT